MNKTVGRSQLLQSAKAQDLSQDLPTGWARAAIADISHKPQYGWTTRATSKGSGLRLLRTTDISEGRIDWSTVPFCESEPPKPGQFLIQSGDILVSRAGSVGLSALIHECPASVFASYLIRLRARTGIDERFFHYFLQSPSYWEQVSQVSAGIALQNINAKKLASFTLQIAPLPEQHRIVAEIEKQFTRLDASVAALKRVQANLERYRASVLKAACEGTLVPTETELARSEGRDYETADRLLQRILAERRARWEAQEKRRGKYKEPAAPDTSDLPELPEGWAWATLTQISDLKGGATKGRRYRPGESLIEVPYLRVANVQRGYLDLSEIKMIEVTHEVADQLALVPGDVLFTEGGDRDKLGRGWVWKGEIDGCIHQNHVFRSRLMLSEMQPEFVSWWGNSFGQTFFEQTGKQTTNLASINLAVLSSFPVPLPPLAEQRRVIAEVERRLSVIQQAEAAVEANVARAERLRQSILKQAFSGKLVPQDPDDEPASMLLERIRAEREAAEAAARSNRKPRRRRSNKSRGRQQTRPEVAS